MNGKIVEMMNLVPWTQRKTASGDGRNLPQALIDLIDSDEEIRKKAYWRLDNHVVLQADLYEAACDVVPILIEILNEHPQYGRDLVYDLLFEIANGYAPEEIEYRSQSGDVLPLVEACHIAVKSGLEIFRRDENDPDLKVRTKASELLELLSNDD